MHCPRCEVEILQERTREGVNIDVCHGCRGIWLDRGELERLIARAGDPPEDRTREDRRGRRDIDDRRRDDDRRRHNDDDDDDDDDRGRGGFFSTLRNLFD